MEFFVFIFKVLKSRKIPQVRSRIPVEEPTVVDTQIIPQDSDSQPTVSHVVEASPK